MRALLVLAVWSIVPAAFAQGVLDASALDRALDDSPYAAASRAFYAARSHEPLWTRPRTVDLSARGRELTRALAQAADDGLDPAAYRPRTSSTPEGREAALTAAFLAFAHDLTRGRAEPEAVFADWRATRRPFDAGAALRLAARLGPIGGIQAARPPYEGYDRLRRALAAYRADEGELWETLADGPPLREGNESMAMQALRDRLIALGFLQGSDHADCCFDASVTLAVRRAQARFGVSVDGVVGVETRDALNVPPSERVRQIELNMERWRWLPADLGDRYVWIDAAGMTVEVVERGRTVWSGRAIVGTLSTPTPGLSSAITHAVFSPFWNVPESIARNEIRPRLRRDPGYLARHDMERLTGGTLRQRPGPANPLGPVKFIFDNPFGVRLHGTATPALFEEHTRTFSHGCIRVESPLALADHLLTDWDADRIGTAVATRSETWVPLGVPVPIHITYWTARADADGEVRFSPDVYGRDRKLAAALYTTARRPS